jgi:hypothetical protein
VALSVLTLLCANVWLRQVEQDELSKADALADVHIRKAIKGKASQLPNKMLMAASGPRGGNSGGSE